MCSLLRQCDAWDNSWVQQEFTSSKILKSYKNLQKPISRLSYTNKSIWVKGLNCSNASNKPHRLFGIYSHRATNISEATEFCSLNLKTSNSSAPPVQGAFIKLAEPCSTAFSTHLGRQWEFRLIIQLFLTIYISQSYLGRWQEHSGRARAARQVGTVSKSEAFKSSP